jgi:hypothetical protein
MVTKRVSPGTNGTKPVTNGTKKAKRKAPAAAAAELTESAVIDVLESAHPAAHSKGIDPNVRLQLVAAEAYFRAERRGFAAGNELEDWVAAEMEVDSRLQQQMQVA